MFVGPASRACRGVLSRGNGKNKLQHGSTHLVIRGVDAHDMGDMIVPLELGEARTVFIFPA